MSCRCSVTFMMRKIFSSSWNTFQVVIFANIVPQVSQRRLPPDTWLIRSRPWNIVIHKTSFTLIWSRRTCFWAREATLSLLILVVHPSIHLLAKTTGVHFWGPVFIVSIENWCLHLARTNHRTVYWTTKISNNADPKSFSFPATLLFLSKSGKTPPEGGGGGYVIPTMATTATAASITSLSLLSLHVGPRIAQYKINTKDGQFASFLADFERVLN